MAFKLELDTQLNDVVLKLNQESLIEVECSLLLQQAEVIVPLLKTKQSISLVIEEKFSQLRDDIGLMFSTNGCYDINHLTPYLKKGNKDQRLSLMYILDWLFPGYFLIMPSLHFPSVQQIAQTINLCHQVLLQLYPET